MNIAGVEIGLGYPCRTVAELSNNHNGDRDRLGRLIDAAQAAGADLVKFQAYTPAELVALRGDGPAPAPWGSQGWMMRTLYEKAQTPLDWFPKIAAHCERIGMPWFSSVFGAESLAALEAVGCAAYKIARMDNRAAHLLAAVQDTGKPVLVSASDPDDVRFRPLSAHGEQVGLLYCAPGYPVAPSDMQMPMFTYHDGPEWEPFLGLSSHCTHPLVGPVAVARGAKLLEFHFQLQRELSELEGEVSLTEDQFYNMVQSVRQAEVLLGG